MKRQVQSSEFAAVDGLGGQTGWGQTANPFGVGVVAGGLSRQGTGWCVHHRLAVRGLQRGDFQAETDEVRVGLG